MSFVDLQKIVNLSKRTKFLSPLPIYLLVEGKKFQSYRLSRSAKSKQIFKSLSNNQDSLCFVRYEIDCKDYFSHLKKQIDKFHQENPGFLSSSYCTLFLIKKGNEYFVVRILETCGNPNIDVNSFKDSFIYLKDKHHRVVVPEL